MQPVGCLQNRSSTRDQFNGVLYDGCSCTPWLSVKHIIYLFCTRRDDNFPPLPHLQMIQRDGGELSFPTFLCSDSYQCNQCNTISYLINVLLKKVDMN